MIFRDRQEAANKLYKLLKKDSSLKKNDDLVVVSLLRGGVVLGKILATKLHCVHLPLVVTKIPAPYNPELAIGALCFDITYLESKTITYLTLNKSDIREQIKIAEHKFIQYCSRFNLNEGLYTKIKNKIVVLVDDGVATGASSKVGVLFLRAKKALKVVLATPVASADTDLRGFDKSYILYRPRSLGAVSQYYRNFPQVEDEEVTKLLK